MTRVLVGLVALAVLVGTGGYAYAQTRDSSPAYRTATATTGTVQHTIALSGSVSATGRRDLSFGTAGAVRSVRARLGQHVGKGQVLARLDPTSLDAQVTSAEAALAKARARLTSDEQAQVDAADAVASAQKAAHKAKERAKKQAAQAAHQAAQQAAHEAAELATVKRQQAAVTSAQTQVSQAMGAADAAVKSEQQACSAPAQGGSGSPACSEAISAVQDAQGTVAAEQQTLQAAISALSATVGAHASKGSSQGGGTGGGGASGHGGSSAGSGGTSRTSSGLTRTVTAATLAQDEAQIDIGVADLSKAEAARSLATLRAPYAGRVVERSISRADLVTASTTAFVLVGKGVTEVSATLSSSQVEDVHPGQEVTVTPAGWTSGLTGSVTLVGPLADDSGNHTVTVTVQSPRTVAQGTTASLSIVVGTARDAVTVPTSSVTQTGSRASVEVLSRGTPTRTSVTVGVVGPRRTSITQGLRSGATVVIADLGAPLPSSDSTSNRRGGFGRAGFGGAGLGGGSFRGPGG